MKTLSETIAANLINGYESALKLTNGKAIKYGSMFEEHLLDGLNKSDYELILWNNENIDNELKGYTLID